MPSCVEDADSKTNTNGHITTDLNNTCTFAFMLDSLGLWETLNSLNVKHLRLQGEGLKVDHVSSLSQSLASLSQLETLTMQFLVFIDLQLPPSLKNLTAYYDALSPAELRHLVNKLSACTQSILFILVFGCGIKITEGTINNIPPEEYIPIQQELQAREHVEVKRFRIYDRKPNTYKCVVDDGDNSDDIYEYEHFKRYIRCIYGDVLNRISMRLQINCVKEQA
ncbi:hypothetical protein DPMN_060979 [Dreissena polymorpha]|uniref:Uncharacterized protein n=1 Tax=Dreissena polymorpha TaxID=45954 RepID=A0A9D4C6L2_DREPO|nr:hypothetical protein DPMN_060979 [Dreissena polymorpha]